MAEMVEPEIMEPWLRGTLTEVEAVRRAVLHALQLAGEDVERWCAELSDAGMFARPFGLPPVAFQLRHIARSLDRLLTYAESGVLDSPQPSVSQFPVLSEAQLAALASEMSREGYSAEVMAEFRAGLASAMERVLAVGPESFGEARGVGRKMLPTTVAGLLIHCAEHTQRHVGQMITTVKIVRSQH
jgi:AcrR family transcriptional regulator